MLKLDLIHSILSLIAYYAFLRVSVASTQLYIKSLFCQGLKQIKKKDLHMF